MDNKNLIKRAWKCLVVTAMSLWVISVKMISLLAISAETPNSDKALSNSDRTGALNYRTGELDDSTDPYGWYDHE